MRADGGSTLRGRGPRPRRQRGRTDARSELPMPGSHNVQNALAAIAVAREIGVDDDAIRNALAGFGGVKRRFTTHRRGRTASP
jgi:UDP-N-acetylmuramate-alanine ligase